MLLTPTLRRCLVPRLYALSAHRTPVYVNCRCSKLVTRFHF